MLSDATSCQNTSELTFKHYTQVFPVVQNTRKEGSCFIISVLSRLTCVWMCLRICCTVKIIYSAYPTWNLIQNVFNLLLFSWFTSSMFSPWCTFLTPDEVLKEVCENKCFLSRNTLLYYIWITTVCDSVVKTNDCFALSFVMMEGNQPSLTDIKSSQTSPRTVELVTAGCKHDIWNHIIADVIAPNMCWRQSSQAK